MNVINGSFNHFPYFMRLNWLWGQLYSVEYFVTWVECVLGLGLRGLMHKTFVQAAERSTCPNYNHCVIVIEGRWFSRLELTTDVDARCLTRLRYTDDVEHTTKRCQLRLDTEP